MMLDGNGALYPVARDCVGMVREPPPLNLPPARALAAHALPLHPHGAAHSHHAALKSQVRLLTDFQYQSKIIYVTVKEYKIQFKLVGHCKSIM